MSLVYEPSRSLSAIVSRRITPFLARRVLSIDLERPLVSFTFDDCPVSAIENGIKPLENEGWQGTVYVAGELLGRTNHHGQQISGADVQGLHASGHEIGGHTWSHIDAQAIDRKAFIEDIERNQSFMCDLGLPTFRTFAYPFGQTEPSIKRLLEKRFDGMRGIAPGIHRNDVDLNQIKSVPLFAGPKMATVDKIMESVRARPAWVTFFTHDIREDHSPWGCSPNEFLALINAVKDMGADVMSVDKAITFLKDKS